MAAPPRDDAPNDAPCRDGAPDDAPHEDAPPGDAPGEDGVPDEEVTLDRLAGAWRVFQLRRGHRFATDDLLVAWTATRAAPGARRLLDLGAGVGSVGLMALHRQESLGVVAHLTAVEVQRVSARLMARTVAHNGLRERVALRNRDLRHPEAVPAGATYDLITANPPYLPPGRAVASPHPQRAAARLELHGDVFDYCAVAARHLAAPGGLFCFCHAAPDPRPEQAVAAAGLTLLRRREVIFRAGKAPTIALFTCAGGGAPDPAPRPLVVRDGAGRWTAEYLGARDDMGLGDDA